MTRVNSYFRLVLFMPVLIFFLFLLGCGGGDERPDAAFHGTVTLDGKPLAAGSIQFSSKKTGEGASVNLNSDGTYSMEMPNANIGDTYSVLIGPEQNLELDPLTDPPPPVVKSPIPKKYFDHTKSDLKVKLKEAGKNEFNFDLKSD